MARKTAKTSVEKTPTSAPKIIGINIMPVYAAAICTPTMGQFNCGELTVQYDSRRVFLRDEEIKLTQTEYNILSFLAQSAGKMMTYAAIIKAIWHEIPDDGNIKRLQVNMANIRKKLGTRPGESGYVINELGVGYRLREE